jgi:hypothetical protein
MRIIPNCDITEIFLDFVSPATCYCNCNKGRTEYCCGLTNKFGPLVYLCYIYSFVCGFFLVVLSIIISIFLLCCLPAIAVMMLGSYDPSRHNFFSNFGVPVDINKSTMDENAPSNHGHGENMNKGGNCCSVYLRNRKCKLIDACSAQGRMVIIAILLTFCGCVPAVVFAFVVYINVILKSLH